MDRIIANLHIQISRQPKQTALGGGMQDKELRAARQARALQEYSRRREQTHNGFCYRADANVVPQLRTGCHSGPLLHPAHRPRPSSPRPRLPG